jgi:hypothetical protein
MSTQMILRLFPGIFVTAAPPLLTRSFPLCRASRLLFFCVLSPLPPGVLFVYVSRVSNADVVGCGGKRFRFASVFSVCFFVL